MKLEKFTRILEQKSKIILGFTGICMILAVIGIFNTNITTSFDIFAPANSSYKYGTELMEKSFGDVSQLLVLIPGGKNVDDLRKSAQLITKISEIDGVGTVLGPVTEETASVSDQELIDYIQQLPDIGGISSFVTTAGKHFITLRIQLTSQTDTRKIVNEVETLLKKAAPGSLLSGEPYLESELFDYILKILLTLPPIAIILMLGVFRIRIGSFRATALSMVPAVIGAVVTLGGLSWILGSISIMSVLVPIFIIVLGSADGLHVTSHVMDKLGEGKSNREAIMLTLETVGTPIILTSLTTMAGFLSLLVVNSPAIREMALTAAAGMLAAGVVTWIILPILLMHQKPLPAREKGNQSRLAEMIWRLKGWPVAVFTILLIAAAIPGALQIKANFSMVDMYKQGTSVRQSIDSIADATGGAFPLIILIEAEQPFGEETAKAVLNFQKALTEQELAQSEVSIYSIIQSLAMQISGKAEYPESEAAARMIAGQIQMKDPEAYNNLVSKDEYTRIILYVPTLDTDKLNTIVELTAGLSDKKGITAYPIGSAFEIMEMNKLIISQQIKSMSIAILIVILLTSIALKSFKTGIKAAIPIGITLLSLFAVMGYAHIDLSIITSIMSGMTIGVGIDYAIHYTSIFRSLEKRSRDNPAHEAMRYVATPILANSLGLSIGFSVMILSPLQIHTTLSILMWVTMVLSSILSLSLLPSLLTKE